MSQKFYTIKVKDVQKTTADATVVSFDVPEKLKEQFLYSHGQHLTFIKDIDGEQLRRSYSLCSSPLENEWKVAVRQVEDGRFSTYVNTQLKAGDSLEVMPPHGRFFCAIDKKKAKRYVAFAAGSGITPILSIIKTHLAEEENSSFSLFYQNRKVQTIMLREEVEGLKNRYLGRFELYHLLTREERDAPLFNGRLNPEKLAEINKKIMDFYEVDEFFLCGPSELIFMLQDYFINLGINKKNIHFELFDTPTNKSGKRHKAKPIVPSEDLTKVTIISNGTTMSFEMKQDGESVLDAALRHNADLPFACKGGVCSTCRAKVIEGEVDMEVNYALEEDEVENGYVLTCQSIPKTKHIIVDYDS